MTRVLDFENLSYEKLVPYSVGLDPRYDSLLKKSRFDILN